MLEKEVNGAGRLAQTTESAAIQNVQHFSDQDLAPGPQPGSEIRFRRGGLGASLLLTAGIDSFRRCLHHRSVSNWIVGFVAGPAGNEFCMNSKT